MQREGIQTEQKRGPGRPRKEETQRRRKRREEVIGRRLGVNESILNFKEYKYRWINDRPGRLVNMTQADDWDFVTNDGDKVKDDGSDLGHRVSQVVGTHPDGSPMMAYLARKPRAFYDEDQAEKMAELDEQLNQLRKGNDKSGEAYSDYVPSGGIQISA